MKIDREIKITINDTTIILSDEEARELYYQLNYMYGWYSYTISPGNENIKIEVSED